MEGGNVRSRMLSQIQHMVGNAIIEDRLFLDDEQLVRSEQLAVLEEIFNANVREPNRLGSRTRPWQRPPP
jgi:hypothetical protein